MVMDFWFFTSTAGQKLIFMFIVTNKLDVKILCNFQIFPCSIHGEIPKNPLSELREKKNSLWILK